MRPFVLWTQQRTASCALFGALLAMAEDKPFAGEPFNGWNDAPLRLKTMKAMVRDGVLIKHLFDLATNEFNVAFAREANEAGYNHVRLMRLDESARLLSLGLAEQSGAWLAGDPKRHDLIEGKMKVGPLRVNDLVQRSLCGRRKWARIEEVVRPLLTIATEHVLAPGSRRLQLMRLLAFLGLDSGKIEKAEAELQDKDQASYRIAHLVPNIAEFREAAAQAQMMIFGQVMWRAQE